MNTRRQCREEPITPRVPETNLLEIGRANVGKDRAKRGDDFVELLGRVGSGGEGPEQGKNSFVVRDHRHSGLLPRVLQRPIRGSKDPTSPSRFSKLKPTPVAPFLRETLAG
jgi:hypothetical protein